MKIKYIVSKIILAILRKRWTKTTRKALVIRVSNEHLGRKPSVQFKNVPRDFQELYFFPALASKLLPKSMELNVEYNNLMVSEFMVFKKGE